VDQVVRNLRRLLDIGSPPQARRPQCAHLNRAHCSIRQARWVAPP